MSVDAKDDENGKNEEAEKADADVSEKTKEEEKEEEVKDNKEEGDEKEEPKSETMEVDEETENNDTEVADTKEEDEDNKEEVPEEKGSKKRSQKKGGGGEKSNTKMKTPAEKKVPEKKKEPTTPVTPTIDRPVRECKSVDRFIAGIEQDTAKEFHIGKGRGTALKDIPNVAYKFSKRKPDESLKLLHSILFGRRPKAFQVKTNILRFSGFVWPENEEKQKLKVKEKLDKCNREKLIEYCNLFDLKVKSKWKKDDIVVKLIDFMLTPHATTSELLAEKDQSSKGKKRPSSSKKSTSYSCATLSKSSSKKQKTKSTSEEEKKKGTPETDESSEEEEQEDEEEKETKEHKDTSGAPENSVDEKSENAASEEEHVTLISLKCKVRGVTPKKSAAKEKPEISLLGHLKRQVMAKDIELANKEKKFQKVRAKLASLLQKQEQWLVEKKELEEKVDSLEHHLQEVQMDKGTREEVGNLESETIKLSSRTPPEICYNCYELFVSPHLLVPLGKFQDQAICLGGH